MAACLAGVTRSPFTAVIFALELTHDIDLLLPLLLACTIAHFVSVLLLKRSILTEKVARRGFHVLREYSVDPLDALFVRDVMETDVVTLAPDRTIADVHASVEQRPVARRQRLLPTIDADGHMIGAVPWVDVLEQVAAGGGHNTVEATMVRDLVVAFPDETLRAVADRMAQRQVGVLPVVERKGTTELRGIITQFDLLAARERILLEERHRERVLSLTALPGIVRSRRRPPTNSPTGALEPMQDHTG
jgi:CBS domain-containing protein